MPRINILLHKGEATNGDILSVMRNPLFNTSSCFQISLVRAMRGWWQDIGTLGSSDFIAVFSLLPYDKMLRWVLEL